MDRFFRAEIDLAAVFASGASAPERPAAVAVEPVEPALDAAWPAWRQNGSVLSLSVDSKAFAYRIALAFPGP